MNPSKTQQKSFPSTSDLAQKAKYEFDNAGSDIEPIPIKNEAQAAKEIEYLSSKIQDGVEWDEEVKAIKRGMGLVNGGALNFEIFVTNLVNISDGLIQGSCNLRSALVKVSCLFLSQLAQKLKSKFSIFGEVIAPLSKQTSHGTLIIAESCKLTIYQIAKYCQKKSTFLSVIELSKSKATANRQICSDSCILMLQFWTQKIIKNNADVFMKTLRLLLTDPQLEVRLTARIAANMFASKYPDFAEFFLASLDPKTKKAVLEAVVPEDTPEIQSPGSPVTPKKKPVSPIKEQHVSPHLYQSKKQNGKDAGDKAETSNKKSRLPPPTRFNKTEKPKESSIPVFDRTKQKSKIPVAQEAPEPAKTSNFCFSGAKRGKSVRTTFKPKFAPADPIRRKHVEAVEEEKEKEPEPEVERKSEKEYGSPVIIKGRRNELISSPPVPKRAKRSSAPQIDDKQAKEVKKKALKRRSSPIPQTNHDQQLTEAIFLLQDGSEEAFFAKIDEYIQGNKTKELKTCLSGIFPGLIKCCAGKNIDYSNRSLTLLSKLIPMFSKEFYSYLPSLLEVIFGGIIDVTDKNKNDIDKILSQFMKYYDQNELISLSIGQIPSKMLVHFIAGMLQTKNSAAIKINTVHKLIKLALSQTKVAKEDSKVIITFIAKQDSKIIADLEATLKDSEADLVKEVLDELSHANEKIEIPQFNYDTQAYCNAIREFVSKFEGNEWLSVREPLYTSINATISISYSPDDLFGVILEIFEKKGVDSYNIFLRSLLVCKNPRKLVNRTKVLAMIGDQAPAQSIVVDFIAPCKGDDYDFAYKALDELNEIIEKHTDKMQPEAKHATELVLYYINSPSIYVRKSVVFIIATLITKYGEAAEQITRGLDLPKKRLISIYIDKKKGKETN